MRIGDLDTPRRDLLDGTVLTFAHDTKGRVREERGETGTLARRLPRRTRAHLGLSAQRGRYRLDHALLKDVEVTARVDAHEWRLSGLSDHSAVIVDVQV